MWWGREREGGRRESEWERKRERNKGWARKVGGGGNVRQINYLHLPWSGRIGGITCGRQRTIVSPCWLCCLKMTAAGPYLSLTTTITTTRTFAIGNTLPSSYTDFYPLEKGRANKSNRFARKTNATRMTRLYRWPLPQNIVKWNNYH